MNCGSLFVWRHSGTMKRRILDNHCANETAATEIAALRKTTARGIGEGNRPPDEPFGVLHRLTSGWFVRRTIEYRRGD